MEWMLLILVVVALGFYFKSRAKPASRISHLPEQFVVFDLETTGLNPEKHEIIEIGAIRVNRDATDHDTFQSLIKPSKRVPKKITEITGISQDMLDTEGKPLESTLREFLDFAGDLHLVSFNADFDMAFLERATAASSLNVKNSVSCALEMARRAWPGRKSYRLSELAKDGNLSDRDTHRALGDCQRALIVYAAAAAKLGSVR